jgi:hypothetical protein
MRLDMKSLRLLLRVSFFAVSSVYLGAVQASADPLAVTGDQKPSLPPASFLGDPLLGSTSPYPFRDAYDYAPHGYPEFRAVLTVPQTHVRQVRQGVVSSAEIFAVDIRLCNDTGDVRSFYNLYWDPFIPMPGRLALYDSQKKYVCDLLERMGGSEETIATSDWASVPASAYIGKILYVSLPYPSYKVTPPGKYYLQVIYLQRVVRPPSETNLRADTPDPIGQSELFRSNAVPITVVNQSAAKMPKPSAVLPKS